MRIQLIYKQREKLFLINSVYFKHFKENYCRNIQGIWTKQNCKRKEKIENALSHLSLQTKYKNGYIIF